MPKNFCLALLLIALLAQNATAVDELKTEDDGSSRLALSVMGWVEDVVVFPAEIKFAAKLDTGAKTSSIDALNIERFRDLDNKEWVRFSIQNADGKRETLEKRVLKWVRIKQKGGGYIQRPVVKMALCVGSHYLEGQMNLAKREGFVYQVVIGRNMLADNILVDAGMRNTAKPECELPNE